MNNRLFTDYFLDVLLNPDGWRVVSSVFAPESQPIGQCTDRAITMHKHAHTEILIVLNGKGEYGVFGRMYPCAPGSVFLIDSFKEHQNCYTDMYVEADHLWVFIFEDHVMFRLIHIGQGYAAIAGLWTHIIPTADIGMSLSGSIICNSPDLGIPNEYRRFDAYSVLTSLISVIVREGYSQQLRDDNTSFQKKVISTIRHHIYETAGKGASLETLAMMSGYSKFHFLRLFNAHTGISLRNYINHCRLERVSQMLSDGCYKKEIALALGFSSLSAFSRWYRGVQTDVTGFKQTYDGNKEIVPV